LSRIVSGPEAHSTDEQLRAVFQRTGLDQAGDLSLDDCLAGKRACLLCITPRSGSTYLSTVLSSTGRMGINAEFMNPGHPDESPVSMRKAVEGNGLTSLQSYIQHVIQRFSTPNGVFTMKGDLYQYLPLIRNRLIRSGLKNVNFVYITRQDLVLQAISLYRATRSGQWSSMHAKQDEVVFDDAAIIEQLEYIVRMMGRWELMFAVLGISPWRVTYEEIVAQPADVVRKIASLTGVDSDLTIKESHLRQLRDELSEEFAQSIRSSANQYIESLRTLAAASSL